LHEKAYNKSNTPDRYAPADFFVRAIRRQQMKIKIISLLVLSLLITGCVGAVNTLRTVTLVGNDKELYIGRLDCNGEGGILSVEVGPNGEKFTGPFVIVDRTAYSRTQGRAIVPQGSLFPAVGSVGSTSSGNVDASGFWYGSGDKGSTMECVLQMGLSVHGHGACKHSNGLEYKILF
jgi:hypothetical protein